MSLMLVNEVLKALLKRAFTLAFRGRSHRLVKSPWFVPHVTGFRRASVQTKSLKKTIWSNPERWWQVKAHAATTNMAHVRQSRPDSGLGF